MMSKEKTPPKYLLDMLGITKREWKQRKRKELKAVMKAINKYQIGCAFCPGYEEFVDIKDMLEKLIDLHSYKRWGR